MNEHALESDTASHQVGGGGEPSGAQDHSLLVSGPLLGMWPMRHKRARVRELLGKVHSFVETVRRPATFHPGLSSVICNA